MDIMIYEANFGVIVIFSVSSGTFPPDITALALALEFDRLRSLLDSKIDSSKGGIKGRLLGLDLPCCKLLALFRSWLSRDSKSLLRLLSTKPKSKSLGAPEVLALFASRFVKFRKRI